MFQCCLQLYKIGGVGLTGGAGNPNLVADLSSIVRQATWSDIQVGGLTTASFSLYYPYETTNTIKGGYWAYFGIYGGQLTGPMVANTNQVVVTKATFDTGYGSISDFQPGDIVMISDGNNTDILKVQSTLGLDPITLTLTNVYSNGPNVLQNSYNAGSKVCRLVYSGKVLNRPRKADLIGSFGISCMGFADRYNNVMCNSDITQQDSGFAIYGIVNSYAPTLPEIVVDPVNMVQSTGLMVGDHQTTGQVMTAINNMIAMENSLVAGTYYAVWVDATRQIYHKQVIVQNSTTYGGGDLRVDGVVNQWGDICGELATTDEDIRNLINCVYCTGGTGPNGTQTTCIVQDTTSIALYGYYEGTFSNTEITDEATLSQWGASSLLLTAYPGNASTMPLKQTQARLTSRDRVQISGFDDSSTQQLNISQVQYNFSVDTMMVTGSLSFQQVLPTLPQAVGTTTKPVMRRQAQSATQQASVRDSYIVRGFDLTVGP